MKKADISMIRERGNFIFDLFSGKDKGKFTKSLADFQLN